MEKLSNAQPPQPYELYWYGMGSDVLDETDAAGSVTTGTFNEYIFFGGKRIARRNSSSNVSYKSSWQFHPPFRF
jgi:hypothetical protein